MVVINFTKFRDEKIKNEHENLDLVMYEDDCDMQDIVFLTVDGAVVVMTHPKDRKGIHLNYEQAADLGKYLLQYSALAAQTYDALADQPATD